LELRQEWFNKYTERLQEKERKRAASSSDEDESQRDRHGKKKVILWG
jgi:hypothetical protein